MDISLLISILGFCGFFIAVYIFHKKHEPKPIVCPIGHSCDPVIRSHYSCFLGIPLELWGIAYYTTISLSYFALYFAPNLFTFNVKVILLGLSTTAFLFSLYLIYIQSCILKEWCSWCLISAGLCATIFTLTQFFL
jgi:uncharacterized membrane protein